MDKEKKLTKEKYRELVLLNIENTLELLKPPTDLKSIPLLRINLCQLYEQLYKLDNDIL